MESNIKGLVAAGHEMASELKAECGAVDMRSVAKLLSDLATQLEVQLARANALAAENAGLKSGAMDEIKVINRGGQAYCVKDGVQVNPMYARGWNDYRKNPYRYRDHQRWPEGKKTAPNRADVGRWQKRVLPQRNWTPPFCRKYAPPTAVRHHQAYRGEACLNRTKKLSLKLLIISRVRAGVCSCRKPKRAWRKKLRSILMTAVIPPFLTRRSHQLLTVTLGSLFFRASQRNSAKEATSE